jgi:hypothetical protein
LLDSLLPEVEATLPHLEGQDWLQKNLMEVWEKEIWHPSSLECSPVGYFAWGISELRLRAKLHN